MKKIFRCWVSKERQVGNAWIPTQRPEAYELNIKEPPKFHSQQSKFVAFENVSTVFLLQEFLFCVQGQKHHFLALLSWHSQRLSAGPTISLREEGSLMMQPPRTPWGWALGHPAAAQSLLLLIRERQSEVVYSNFLTLVCAWTHEVTKGENKQQEAGWVLPVPGQVGTPHSVPCSWQHSLLYDLTPAPCPALGRTPGRWQLHRLEEMRLREDVPRVAEAAHGSPQ